MNCKQLILLGGIVSFGTFSIQAMKRIGYPSQLSKPKIEPQTSSKKALESFNHYKENLQLRVKSKYVAPFVKRSALSWMSAAVALKLTKGDATAALGTAAAVEVLTEVFGDNRYLNRDEDDKLEFLAIKEKELLSRASVYPILHEYRGLLRRYKAAIEDSMMYEEAKQYDTTGVYTAEIDARKSSPSKKYPGTMIEFQRDDEEKLPELWKTLVEVYGISITSFEELYKVLSEEAREDLRLTGIILDSLANSSSKRIHYLSFERVKIEVEEVKDLLSDFQAILEITEQENTSHSGNSDNNS